MVDYAINIENLSGGKKRKLKITKEHQNEHQKNLFKFFKKDQNHTIADSGQIEI